MPPRGPEGRFFIRKIELLIEAKLDNERHLGAPVIGIDYSFIIFSLFRNYYPFFGLGFGD